MDSGGLTNWLVEVLHSLHYVGIFLLVMLARIVPPVPAESVIPLAGLGAATGEFSLIGVALAGGLGSLAGQLVWFLPSRLLGRDRLEAFLKRYGHWLTIWPEKVRATTDWFAKRGGIAVLLSQPVPGARTLISIPAGICRMPIGQYCLWAGLGSLSWTFILAGSGYMLSSWPFAHRLIGYVTVGLLVLLLGLYTLRLVRHFAAKRARRAQPAARVGESRERKTARLV